MQRLDPLSGYQKIQKIGEGTYGVVFKARRRDTRDLEAFVAIKKIRLDHEDEGVPSTALREMAALKELDHSNVVSLIDIKHSLARPSQKLYLIFEYLDQDLKKYMDSVKSMSQPLVRSYSEQLLRGLDYCHGRRIMHRDLKPQNLLIDKQGNLKLADFGLARAFSLPVRPFTREVITLWYRAPELLLGSPTYSTPVDVWSAGCIIAEMSSHRPLFPGDSEIDQLYKMFRTLGTPTDEEWPGVTQFKDYKAAFPQWPKMGLTKVVKGPSLLLDLLSNMMVYDPSCRVSAKHALLHDFFQNELQ